MSAPGHKSPESAADTAGDVPWSLRLGASWTWRLLLVAAGAVLLVRALADLRLVVLPLIVAVFLTTLLMAPTRWLRETGLPSGIAAAFTLLSGIAVIGGIFALVGPAVAGEVDELGRQVRLGAQQFLDWVAEGPLGLGRDEVRDGLQGIVDQARASAGAIGGGLLSGAVLVAEALAGLLIALVLTFFFLKDGHRMWAWFLTLFDTPAQRRDADELGSRIWTTATSYLRGLMLVALFDSIFIGIALLLIGVPLVLPLAVLTFFGAFIPIVGAVVAGAAATLVALVTGGVSDALLVLAATVAVQQIESEILYPVVVGRVLELHPVPILLAVTAGGVLYGVGGAALAAPLLAIVVTIASFLRERRRRTRNAEPGGAQPVHAPEPVAAEAPPPAAIQP